MQMKKIFILIVSLLAFVVVYSQTADLVVSDTTYIEQRGEARFYIQKITYGSGRIVTDERPATAIDTTVEVNRIVSEIFPQLEQYAAAALVVAGSREIQRKIRSASQSIQSLTGRSLSTEIDNRLTGLSLEGDYRLRQGAITTDATISRSAQGVLRMRESNVNYPIFIISRRWIQVKYKGTDFDLFWDGEQWVDLSSQISLKKK